MNYYGVIVEIIDRQTYVFNIIDKKDFSILEEQGTSIWNLDDEVINFPSHYIIVKLPNKISIENKKSIYLRKQEWFEIDLDFDTKGEVTFYESILSTDSSKVMLNSIAFIDGRSSFGRVIHNLFSLNPLPDAREDELITFLANSADKLKGHFLGSYYVGQGSCNSICDINGVPQLYFDLGGGYHSNSYTYPDTIKLCNCENPNVILSHWDGDHWVSVRKFPAFERSNWLVPRQKLTADALKTANAIHKNGKLLIWPNSLSEIPYNFLKIVKCTGKISNINNSGLAFYYNIDKELTCLLPGDATYTSIPHAKDSSLNGLIVTHHGGTGYQNIPIAQNSHIGVYSYGLNNSYNHPLLNSINEHSKKNWNHIFNSFNGHIAIGSNNALKITRANNHIRTSSNCNTSFFQYKTF